MNQIVKPGQRSGCVCIPASKSQAHRLLIEAALGNGVCRLRCDGISRDIEATARCLSALGADITEDGGVITVRPLQPCTKGERALFCGESGSTLRFLLPLVGALGADAVFYREGRLPSRPLSPLDEELKRHGMTLKEEGPRLYCSGQLEAGDYVIAGNVSSQYISGLLMALPTLDSDSTLTVTGPVESAGYITMTEDALQLAGIRFEKNRWTYIMPGRQRAKLPPETAVEGDWSNAAFFLSIGALSEGGIKVMGMNPGSSQGDRAVLEILKAFGAECCLDGGELLIHRGRLRAQTIDAGPIPDLIPVLSVVAALAEGETRVVNAARLRLKESDRLSSTTAMLRALGAEIEELPDGLIIRGKKKLNGGTVDPCGDHRIAMAAAVAATGCTAPVTIQNAECVQKSYPRFWEDFAALSGGEA